MEVFVDLTTPYPLDLSVYVLPAILDDSVTLVSEDKTYYTVFHMES